MPYVPVRIPSVTACPFVLWFRCCLAPALPHNIRRRPLTYLRFQEAEKAIVKASAEKERRRSSAAAAAAWVPKALVPNGVANGDGMKTPVKG